MRGTRPIFWIFVPVLLALSIGGVWGTVNYGPIGKPSPAVSECANLRDYITSEETSGKASWTEYRTYVDQYVALSSTSSDRITLVEKMAGSVIDVLGHDLAIYKEMNRYPSCVIQDKRQQISGFIDETESAINFLNGSAPINGNYFDPQLGTWNTAFYEEYMSALDYLKPLNKSNA